MDYTVKGFHHITAIAGEAKRNLTFYTEVLGLRLVKKTVNFDDSGTYHFYFGNETGEPGSLMTTFPIPRALLGKSAGGMVTATAFLSSLDGIDEWREKLGDLADEPQERFGEIILPFKDPDDLPLEIVFAGDAESPSITGLHSVSLASWDLDATCRVLSEVFGFAECETE